MINKKIIYIVSTVFRTYYVPNQSLLRTAFLWELNKAKTGLFISKERQVGVGHRDGHHLSQLLDQIA